MAENAQAITALSLLRSGVSLQLFGLVWGLIIPVTPFPKLALTAHIQSMAQAAAGATGAEPWKEQIMT
ncbi:hypothetical protein V1520DRAFT_356088 [Lipomyces starkeyi]|uniref:Uncharacterized protein n=1 Tax=Lipomyces starkeyi NRRL Y-11557 TaxID=675824 RepID=A0A1E3Q3I6_LIPST|nr:hypothetical protein LIPSTDRAFT_4611 [Lipomyces starkeyi NRRL Y-11557]